jgi:hypothetical protein
MDPESASSAVTAPPTCDNSNVDELSHNSIRLDFSNATTNGELSNNSVTHLDLNSASWTVTAPSLDTSSSPALTTNEAVTTPSLDILLSPAISTLTTTNEAVTTPSLDILSSPAISTLTTNDSGPMDIDDSTTDPMEADQSASNVVEVSAPAWMTALKMDIYFQELSDEKAWKVLVQSIYKFEIGNTINGVC